METRLSIDSHTSLFCDYTQTHNVNHSVSIRKNNPVSSTSCASRASLAENGATAIHFLHRGVTAP